MTRKFGKPISKAGKPYDYNAEWLSELAIEAMEKYPNVKHRFLKAYKTRTRNIIKEEKNFNALRFFAEFLVKNYEEEIAPINYTTDIDEEEIPF
jgi:hypothetical protein